MATKFLHHHSLLCTIKQQENETITEYMNRFNLGLKNVVEGHEEFKTAAFIDGLKRDELYIEFIMDEPGTLEEAMQVVGKYARGEEADHNKIDVFEDDDDEDSATRFLETMMMRYPELRKVKDKTEAYGIAAFMNAVPPGELNRALARDPPMSFLELMQTAEIHRRADEIERAISRELDLLRNAGKDDSAG